MLPFKSSYLETNRALRSQGPFLWDGKDLPVVEICQPLHSNYISVQVLELLRLSFTSCLAAHTLNFKACKSTEKHRTRTDTFCPPYPTSENTLFLLFWIQCECKDCSQQACQTEVGNMTHLFIFTSFKRSATIWQ